MFELAFYNVRLDSAIPIEEVITQVSVRVFSEHEQHSSSIMLNHLDKVSDIDMILAKNGFKGKLLPDIFYFASSCESLLVVPNGFHTFGEFSITDETILVLRQQSTKRIYLNDPPEDAFWKRTFTVDGAHDKVNCCICFERSVVFCEPNFPCRCFPMKDSYICILCTNRLHNDAVNHPLHLMPKCPLCRA